MNQALRAAAGPGRIAGDLCHRSPSAVRGAGIRIERRTRWFVSLGEGYFGSFGSTPVTAEASFVPLGR
ncbi:hypothetical protein [Streptomyces sp. NPDC059994]|uniref:hypothetical protein n=1 Tax=Streptomyces sp. NPDC059994 TaxID=3347029 RepID=UPI0036825338